MEVDVDGRPASPLSVQSLSDWSTASSEASPSWRPPLAVGLVYLWVDGVPSAVLDGIHAFFQRLPSRTVVYPTIYGRLRQGRARLTAGDISRLDEVPYLDGYRPNMIDAVRMNLVDLANDPASLKILLLVTDGRDYADPKAEGPGDFGALGAELRGAGIASVVTRFRPEADAEQAAANLRDLSEAAGGFLDARDQPEELENTLESLGQGVADLQRVELPIPWTWRLFPRDHRIAAHLTTPAGERLSAELGTVRIGVGPFMAVAGGAFGLSALSFVVWSLGGLRRRKRTDPETDVSVEAVLATAHNLIRRGLRPSGPPSSWCESIRKLAGSWRRSTRNYSWTDVFLTCGLDPVGSAFRRFERSSTSGGSREHRLCPGCSPRCWRRQSVREYRRRPRLSG